MNLNKTIKVYKKRKKIKVKNKYYIKDNNIKIHLLYN